MLRQKQQEDVKRQYEQWRIDVIKQYEQQLLKQEEQQELLVDVAQRGHVPGRW